MNELYEIKKLLLEQRNILETLFPKKVALSFICERTGLTRQGVRNKLISNYEIDTDFWKEGGKIFISKEVAFQLINIKKANK